MTTARVLAGQRGRPSVASLQVSLEEARAANGRLRDVNVNLALELAAERGEHRAFVERVKAGVETLIAVSGSRMAVVNEAHKLGYLADRRLAQIGSIVL